VLRVNIDKIAKNYEQMQDDQLLELGRGGQLTAEARLALKTELLKRGHKDLDWIDQARALSPACGPELQGMGGWLWGLSAFTGAVYPALMAWFALRSWQVLAPVLRSEQAGFPPLVTGLLWVTLLGGVLGTLLGPLSALWLRREDRRGPALARAVLYLALLTAMTRLLSLGPTHPLDQVRTLLGNVGWLYSVHAVLAGGWLLYLNHSRRVRRTFYRERR
jgi:hypothetical protein